MYKIQGLDDNGMFCATNDGVILSLIVAVVRMDIYIPHKLLQ